MNKINNFEDLVNFIDVMLDEKYIIYIIENQDYTDNSYNYTVLGDNKGNRVVISVPYMFDIRKFKLDLCEDYPDHEIKLMKYFNDYEEIYIK